MLCGAGAARAVIRQGESGGKISAVEDPVAVIRSEQVEVAVLGFWFQRCWQGEGDVLLASPGKTRRCRAPGETPSGEEAGTRHRASGQDRDRPGASPGYGSRAYPCSLTRNGLVQHDQR